MLNDDEDELRKLNISFSLEKCVRPRLSEGKEDRCLVPSLTVLRVPGKTVTTWNMWEPQKKMQFSVSFAYFSVLLS